MKIKETVGLIAGIIGIIAGTLAIKNTLSKQVIPRVDGNWILTFEVFNSSSQRYMDGNLSYSYNIFLTQNAEKVNGTGEKIREMFNQKETEYTGQQKTPIEISGSIDIKRLSATIKEFGLKRESTGLIEFSITDLEDGEAEGTFSTSAGNSSGKATIRKI